VWALTSTQVKRTLGTSVPSKGNLGNLGNEVLSTPESCLEQVPTHIYIYIYIYLLLLIFPPKTKVWTRRKSKESTTTTTMPGGSGWEEVQDEERILKEYILFVIGLTWLLLAMKVQEAEHIHYALDK
jgi:hypothetical protein